MKWKSVLGVLCDSIIYIKRENKFDKTIIQPSMFDGCGFHLAQLVKFIIVE